jgi:hypothetical protein
MSGITISSPAPFTTTPVQNVSGGNSATGFFFLNGWDTHPEPGLQYVQPSWTVVGQPTWVVTAVGNGINDETITITGGQFLAGSSYQFVSPELLGIAVGNGITIGT